MPYDQLFKKGDSVEVSPEDIGLSGSWYEATIISIPQTLKTIHKNPNLIYYDVEYKTLLDDEDETKLLMERVRGDRIRPLPPHQPEHCFQLNEVVDVFHRDGWWVGVITEILEDSGNFLMTFTDPPDLIQSPASDMRVHLEWNHGAWVQPQAPAANQLEIEDNSLKNKRGRFRQEMAEDGASKSGSRRVIQTPPSRKRKVLESSDQVKKRSSTRRRTGRSTNQNVDKETLDQAVSVPIAGGGNGTTHLKSNKEPKIVGKSVVVDFYGYKFVHDSGGSVIANEAAMEEKNRRTLINSSQESFHELLNHGLENIHELLNPSHENINELLNPSQENVHELLNPSQENVHELLNPSQENVNVLLNPSQESVHALLLNPSQENNHELLNPSRENVHELLKPGQENVHELLNLSQENIHELLDPSQEMDNVDQATVFEGHGNNFINPIQKIGIMQQRADSEENENNFVNPSQETDIVEGNVDDCNDLKLPFQKTLALWNIIESMSVSKFIRQRPPHFRSLLDKYPVHYHEGKAIGYILMFHEVVQKTATCKLNEDRKSILEILDTLPKLDKNGFEVKEIHNHLTKLLEKKDEYDLIKNQLMEQNQKKEKVVEVIEELNKEIKERQKKCDEAIFTKENIECEIACIESNLVALCRIFEENVSEFE